jgi:hypothetical protein
MASMRTDAIKFLTLEETTRLFDGLASHRRDKAIFLLAYRHGLRDVRRRYISSVDMLRRAIAIVADGTLRARNPAIWGTATTAWSGRGMIEQIGGELRRQAHHVDRNPRPGQRACVRLTPAIWANTGYWGDPCNFIR